MVTFRQTAESGRTLLLTKDVLARAYSWIDELVRRSVEGLDPGGLAFRPAADANSIAWLIWHLARVQDHHISEIAGREQAWISEGWAGKVGMEPDPSNTGYGHSSEEVAAIGPEHVDGSLDYLCAVSQRTMDYLATVDADELDRIIDHSYDPPVSVGVRLVSVIGDCFQHLGQVQYIRGLYERRR